MDAAVDEFMRAIAGASLDRARPERLARIRVDAWCATVPLEQIANVGVQPPRSFVVTPHDPSLVIAVARAIANSDVGARPRVDGPRVRLELPAPTDEARERARKQIAQHAESARVAIRGARRDALNELRRRRAADDVSQAQLNGRSKQVQTLCDEHITRIDELLARAQSDVRS